VHWTTWVFRPKTFTPKYRRTAELASPFSPRQRPCQHERRRRPCASFVRDVHPESLAATARHALARVTPGKGASFHAMFETAAIPRNEIDTPEPIG